MMLTAVLGVLPSHGKSQLLLRGWVNPPHLAVGPLLRRGVTRPPAKKVLLLLRRPG